MSDSQSLRGISSFKGDYAFLSNFAVSLVKFDGLHFSTVEHAYQAAKTVVSEERRDVMRASTPGAAKRAGRRVTMREGWEDMKLQIMEDLLRQKFDQASFQEALLATGDAKLVEGNTWGDTYWGFDTRTGKGENHLGKLLMKIREELWKEQENGRSTRTTSQR